MPAKKPVGIRPKRKLKERWRNWRAYRIESASVRNALGKTLRKLKSAEHALEHTKNKADEYERQIEAAKPLLPWRPTGVDYYEILNELRRPIPQLEVKIRQLKEEKAPLERQLAAIMKKYGYNA